MNKLSVQNTRNNNVKNSKKNIFTKLFLGISSVALITNIAVANNKVIDGLNTEQHFFYAGSLKLTNSNLKSSELRGTSNLVNNQVDGPLGIHGKTELTNNKFNDGVVIRGDLKSDSNKYHERVEVHGNFRDKNSNFLGDLTLAGRVVFEGSNVEADLVIDSNEARFVDTRTKNIRFTNDGQDRDINLYIKKNTSVNGNIIFDNNRGRVHLDKESSISGKIDGGVMIQK